jgi:CRISPR-associated endonuclease/helicase Cas3
LERHLEEVSDLAGGFAAAFDSSEWGRLAGLWHDLGKYQEQFQRRLRGDSMPVEHSGLGAAYTHERFGSNGLGLSFAIAGHHAGLSNWASSDDGLPVPLKERLAKNIPLLKTVLPAIPESITEQNAPALPILLEGKGGMAKEEAKRRQALWVRFLFSTLVDADRLNSAVFCNPDEFEERGNYASISSLRTGLDEYIDKKVARLTEEERSHTVNQCRHEVLGACRKAALEPPGFFSLTVPTGGGKTLSGLSFALRHAEAHGLRRVIVVIPYTSIIEQSASVYRKAFEEIGNENVLEHHSNLDPERAKRELGEDVARRHEMSAENWDAPVIVTTTVQFFETLFASHPSRCRKLHNVARSAIILDEVQSLPPGFLLPIVDALKGLVDDYRCTVVLSTATPPALGERKSFPQGLRDVRPIIANPLDLSLRLKRVLIQWPKSEEEKLDHEALAVKLAGNEQVLTVVNRRDEAREVAMLLQEKTNPESVFHLSALMCPAHRRESLKIIKARLKEKAPCRLVSTQLIEAGVDIDFPVVYRAMAGLDSIVQAAGRCNREGRTEKGEVFVFRSENLPPRGTPKKGMEVTEGMLRDRGGILDPEDPTLFDAFFRQLYMLGDPDLKGILTNLQQFNFASVGRDFRLIEDGFTKSVIVPYGDSDKKVKEIQDMGTNRGRLRALQPYLVSVYDNAFQKLRKGGALEEIVEGMWFLTDLYHHIYDSTFGLVVGDEPGPDPGRIVV